MIEGLVRSNIAIDKVVGKLHVPPSTLEWTFAMSLEIHFQAGSFGD